MKVLVIPTPRSSTVHMWVPWRSVGECISWRLTDELELRAELHEPAMPPLLPQPFVAVFLLVVGDGFRL
eukprot:434426-Amphidinium_carterae.1